LEIQFLKYTNIVNAKENIRYSHKKTMWISYNIRKSSAGPTRTNNGFQTSEIYGLPNSDSANAVRHTFFKELHPFWQMLWVAELRFGKCRQAYFF